MENRWWSSLTFVFVTSAAHAQSSVTLYGLIDVGVNYLSNAQTGQNAQGQPVGKPLFSMSDGAARGTGGSRWGLKGSEDLGGGLSAIFTLENGFLLTNGSITQGGAEFGRQSFVGLSSPLGTATLGRQYDTEADFIAPFTPVQIAGVTGSLPGDIDGSGHTRHVNNAVKYLSGNYGGLQFGASYSIGGQPGNVTANQVWAAAGNYSAGPFSAGIGYYNARNPNVSSFGTVTPTASAASNSLGSFGSMSSPQANPVYAGYASAHTFEIYAVGASYKIGKANVSISVSHSSFDGLGDTDSGPNPLHYHGTAVFNNAAATAYYWATPAFQVGGAYTYSRAAGVSGQEGATYQQEILTLQYFLSKRTEVYLFAAYQLATGINSLGQRAVASMVLATPSSNSHQLIARAGVVHRF